MLTSLLWIVGVAVLGFLAFMAWGFVLLYQENGPKVRARKEMLARMTPAQREAMLAAEHKEFLARERERYLSRLIQAKVKEDDWHWEVVTQNVMERRPGKR